MQEREDERSFVAAVIQLSYRSQHLDDFFVLVRSLVDEAVFCGASLVVLPELFAGPNNRVEALYSGVLQDFLSSLALESSCWLVGGSLSIQSEQAKPYNTLLLYDPSGQCVAHYHKKNLFCSFLPDTVVDEVDQFLAGSAFPQPYSFSFGRLGFAICYDIRFPELFAVQKADFFAVPSAFRYKTGRDHWEILLRARAIENQSFVLGANYSGGGGDRQFWGHSLIIDPWGRVLASCPENGDAVATARIDLQLLSELRSALPMKKSIITEGIR